jgi:hypothetical protein
MVRSLLGFLWPFPAGDGDLPGARDGQRLGRGVLGQGRARAQCGAAANGNRCNQLSIGTDEGIVLDDGLEFVGPIVVAGDGTGTNVYPAADDGVADVGKVIGLRLGSQLAVLEFDEVADMDAGSEFRAGTKSGRTVRSPRRVRRSRLQCD